MRYFYELGALIFIFSGGIVVAWVLGKAKAYSRWYTGIWLTLGWAIAFFVGIIFCVDSPVALGMPTGLLFGATTGLLGSLSMFWLLHRQKHG
jgi:hypothetical protein